MRTSDVLLSETGQRLRVFVPRVLHPVRLRSLRARSRRRNWPGDFYWWDQLNYLVIPFQRRAHDEWPLEFRAIDPITSGGINDLELDAVAPSTGLTGTPYCQPWPGFIYGPATGLRSVAPEVPCQPTVRRVSGSASPVGRRAASRSSSSWTGPTGPSPAAASAAEVRSASSTRSSAMTSALNSHEYTAPHNNPEVARIMEEKGVGRKRAYTILRQAKASQFTVEVPQTQRAQVLTSLVDHAGQAKNAVQLLEQLHADGVRIDMHDVVKSLWSLQKTRFVQFRERNNPPSLYAIVVTDQGMAAYADMKERLAQQELDTVLVAQSILREAEASVALDHDPKMETQSVAPDAPDFVQERIPESIATDYAHTNGVEVTTILPGTPEWDESERALEQQRLAEHGNIVVLAGTGIDLSDFPLMRSIRDRARKESVLAKAAALLEDAGEDDMALDVMNLTQFNALELEVKQMLHTIGEV